MIVISGPVVGKFAMDLAIEKAKKAGIGLVSARGMINYLNNFVFCLAVVFGIFHESYFLYLWTNNTCEM